jgi:hypothetical protein
MANGAENLILQALQIYTFSLGGIIVYSCGILGYRKSL